MIIKSGTTNVLLFAFLRDSSVSYPKGLTGLTSSSSSLACYYMRDNESSPTQITLSAGTVGTYSSGGFVEVNSSNLPGMYQLGLPKAVTSSGASFAMLEIKGAANLADFHKEITLWSRVPSDNYTILSSEDTMRKTLGILRIESDLSKLENLTKHIESMI